MSATPATSQQHPADHLRCARCDAVLAPYVQVCGSCGARVEKTVHQSIATTTINSRYHITALLHSQPYMRLFKARDTLLQKPVVIRDIDVSMLAEEAQAEAVVTVRSEHDALHHLNVPYLMTLFDLYQEQGHIYSAAETAVNFPVSQEDAQTLYTLDDLLQSGIGLPDEQIAIAWICRLCQATDRLHTRQIISGDLDPHSVIVSSRDYDGWPALSISWMPQALRLLLPPAAHSNYALHFSAPEALNGVFIKPVSDVYSLGALLYLLLTGKAPTDALSRERQALPAPHEIDPHISADISTVVMRALALECEERYTNVRTLAHDLLHPPIITRPAQEQPDQNGTESQQEIIGSEKLLAGLNQLQKRLTRKLAPHKTLPLTSPARQQHAIPSTPEISDASDFALADLPTIRLLNIFQEIPEPEEENENAAEEWQEAESPGEVESSEETEEDELTPTVPLTPRKPATHRDEEAPQESGQPQQIETEVSPVIVPDDLESAEPGENIAQQAEVEQVEGEEGERGEEQPEAHAGDIDTLRLRPLIKQPIKQAHPKDSEHHDEDSVEVDTQRLSPAHMLARRKAASEQEQPQTITPAQEAASQEDSDRKALVVSPGRQLPAFKPRKKQTSEEKRELTLLKRLQHFFLGRQQHNTTAAALIETPLRIQPNQAYSIRIHIMGRNEIQGERSGLRGMIEGEQIHIEVRSAMPNRYAYIVQRASVQLPGAGFAAEVTIPMRPLSNELNGRRERLHIQFMDKQHNQLYEKPFAIEIFVSHLVQAGREGHNMLPIPL